MLLLSLFLSPSSLIPSLIHLTIPPLTHNIPVIFFTTEAGGEATWRSSWRSKGKERYVPSFFSISPLNALYHSHYLFHTTPALFYLHDFSHTSSAAQVLFFSSSSLYNFSTSTLIFSHLSILSFFYCLLFIYYLFINYLFTGTFNSRRIHGMEIWKRK
jgi:hypothetical protein